jgi:hypothetical protein
LAVLHVLVDDHLKLRYALGKWLLVAQLAFQRPSACLTAGHNAASYESLHHVRNACPLGADMMQSACGEQPCN